MCGIAGFVNFQEAPKGALLAQRRGMADTLLHRGPDAGACWADPNAGFATGHRRLSIVELSEAGAQPMVSQSGRFVISYNGEVYNAAEIRPDLEAKGYVFRGHSDTEVILEACAEWGVQATVPRLIGMFAFALWDRQPTGCGWYVIGSGLNHFIGVGSAGFSCLGPSSRLCAPIRDGQLRSTATPSPHSYALTTSRRRTRFIGTSISCRQEQS